MNPYRVSTQPDPALAEECRGDREELVLLAIVLCSGAIATSSALVDGWTGVPTFGLLMIGVAAWRLVRALRRRG